MQIVELTHRFKDYITNIDELFVCKNECGHINTINSFCKRVDELSEKYSDTKDTYEYNDCSEISTQKAEVFKGDALEILVEYLCKTESFDNRIGIYNYQVVPSSEDRGVDGYGMGDNGKPATVQVKYRTGDYVLTTNADHLSNFSSQSWGHYGVDVNDKKNMLIVTTAKDLHYDSLNLDFGGKVRVLNREDLRHMLDNRPMWWKHFWESMKGSRIKPVPNNKKTLREHQKECLDVIDKKQEESTKGIIVLPTGTGKTIVEADIIRTHIKSLKEEGIIPLIKVNSSRILLCFQLFEEISAYLLSHGIEARYINFNSGNASDEIFLKLLNEHGKAHRPLENTTKISQLTNIYEKCIEDNMPLVVFSTYHSSDNFSWLDEKYTVNLTIHDEAHNLVAKDFTKILDLPSTYDFFFTATMKYTDSSEDIGMNNIKKFGPLMFERSAKTMVESGEMVMPRIHVVKARKNQVVNLKKLEEDYDALLVSITDAFRRHEIQIKKDSANSEEIGAKVLVVCRGQQDLIEMFDTHVFDNFRKENPDVHVYALSSEFGVYQDGRHIPGAVTNIKKYKLIRDMKELKNEDKALIFHVDMIGEGIDVPGITGVMPFRNCELSKFIQNIGRAARLHPIDRQKYYAGEIDPEDRSKWIKPFSWVIIPSFLESSQGYERRFRDIIDNLRNTYDTPIQDVLIDNLNGIDEDLEIDTVNEVTKNPRHQDSGLEEFEHILENLSPSERVLYQVKEDDLYNSLVKNLVDDKLFNV